MEEFWRNKHIVNDEYWLTYTPMRFLREIHKLPELKDKVVLEVGIGNGKFVKRMAEDNKVYAVDIVQEALDRVSDVAITVLTANMKDIPDNSVDFALCHLVFQHCSDDVVQYILNEVIRILKPNGCFSFQTANNKNPSGKIKKLTEKGWLRWRSLETIKAMVIKAGGQITYVSPDKGFPVGGLVIWHILHCKKK